LWGDEAYLVASFYDRGFADMFKPLDYAQLAPLAFMWADLAASKLLGLSALALRIPAFACGLFSIFVFWRFTRRILDKRAALLAIAIFASSFYVVRHSAEVKPYAQDLAVSLVLLWLGWAVYRRSDSVLRWLGLIIVAALGLWCSYPAVFIAGAVAIFLAWSLWPKRSAKLFLWILLYALIMAASFLAMYLFYIRAHEASAAGIREIRTWTIAFPPFSQPWRLPFWFLDVHTGNMLAYPVGGKNFGSTLTFLLVVVGVITLWRNRQKPLLLLLLAPLPLMLVAAALHKYPYGTSARISQHLAPAICLLAGAGLAKALRFLLNRQRLIGGFYIATSVIAFIALGGIVRDIAK
ncbi:MAG: glycosyltransferase family 39 protein, partial [Planctomycetota bacterium]|nr:glycosyltransferase family 39 protein [Planctomycetota bacterium]